jgi:hypothetical protein
VTSGHEKAESDLVRRATCFVTEYATPDDPQPDFREKVAEKGDRGPVASSSSPEAELRSPEAAFSSSEAIRIGNRRPQIRMHTRRPGPREVSEAARPPVLSEAA